MITKKKKENFIKYLFPFQFSHNKGTIMSFFSDIFVNFQKDLIIILIHIHFRN